MRRPRDPVESDVREHVREVYADLAHRPAEGTSCCSPQEQTVFGAGRYERAQQDELPGAATLASLGCGNPTAVAELREGETVLDLGSGGGIDVLLSARRVGPTGKAYGLDMTNEMLELARRNARDAGTENVEWLKGHIEEIPLPDASIDVVISNCVINLSPDKRTVLREVARVLRPGGRFAVSDVICDEDAVDTIRQNTDQWAECISGALTVNEYSSLLTAAGLDQIEIVESHRVAPHAAAAIIRARKPLSQHVSVS
jgi:SAM-dependent methyltransferase